jgi:ATP-binding cassette, subfamily B, bacterial
MQADVEASIEVLYPIPFAIVSLFVADVFLALIGILTIPVLALMNRSFAKRMRVRRAPERIGNVSSVAHESIYGALVVKTLGRGHALVAQLLGSLP